MLTSVFENSEEMWMADVEQRSLKDLIDVDFRFALHNQNTNAVRTCVGRFQKCMLSTQDIESIHKLLDHANNFNAMEWIGVLRMCHLHDKKLDIAQHWVNSTPTIVEKLQELLHNSLPPGQRIKTQALVVQYTLRTPYIQNIAALISPSEKQTVLEYMLNPLFSEPNLYSANGILWAVQTAKAVSEVFPEYSRAVFYRIAARAFAFHAVNEMYMDQNINRSSFYRALEEQGNEGVSASNLSMFALDSSMNFNHRKDNAMKDLEEIYVCASIEQQNRYLQDLAQSKYATMLCMSDILQSAAQKMLLKNQLDHNLVAPQDERHRKI